MPIDGFEEYTDVSSSVRKYATRVLDGLRNKPGIKIKSKRLEAILDINGNEVRAIIHYLRGQGYPICSSTQGYWYTDDPEEIDKSINHLRQRANSITSVANALHRAKTVLTSTKHSNNRKEVQKELF